MQYTKKELLPIVTTLAEKYTGFASDSITYETLEQLIGAVQYCLQQAEQLPALLPEQTAQQAYQAGVACVEKKTAQALQLYNQLMTTFCWYENRCLHDTMLQGLPEFFKWYDVKFAPQNTIILLDYPVLRSLTDLSGIDKVYEFLCCITLEQNFLSKFPEQWVLTLLSRQGEAHQELVENLCEIVLTAIAGHLLIQKPLLTVEFTEDDYLQLQALLQAATLPALQKELQFLLNAFLEAHWEHSAALMDYASEAINGIAVRLKTAAAHTGLWNLL